ncbi:bacillithiol biosynthesis cysteine-adding enzyme BshC [Chryseobacterium sp. Leaf404]|uniref:bacillithiol biosynthesis cysteine-adding enzyme BshC n=1 Tax=unclassified Chryseobacterium TaxID=2593645 RepID=UPI0006FE4779|nr:MULTISPECIES: bacillithiol biosynthesis cysteine-adding enzyme BshC [unclassified Chryseobacterium]KQT15488.1 bacillithiol biosynthesis cysteine-adding enzyme BshC [Chryseobacterium sp. Leaf404]
MRTLKTLDFKNIQSIPQLIKDFISGQIEGFEEHTFSKTNFEKQIEKKRQSFADTHRHILSNELGAQLSGLKLSELQKENLEKLKNSETFTITTGHQLNLFTGPAFFIYKILQTVKTCVYLKDQFPDQNFVPIYWMASEDHDFLEINHFKTHNGYHEISGKSGGAVGKIEISDTHFITEFEKEFKDHIFGTELILMLKESYQTGNTLTEAIRILVNRLFSEYGLLIIDGDSKALKAQMKEIFQDEILNSALRDRSEQKVDFLSEKYGKVQVNPRDVNLFYLSETRNRIDIFKDEYQVNETEISFSKDEIIDELNSFPEKFSPNALMRPVYQEKILPNLAYIGGNAEIMYWLELKDYFESVKIPFPVLIPRNSMVFVEEKVLKKIETLKLNIEDFFGNFTQVTNAKILDDHEILKSLDEKEIIIQQHFQNLKALAEKTEKSFGNMVKGEEIRQMKSFSRLKKRLLKAEKIKQGELLERLENLFAEINPAKIWQERVYNFSVFFADHGTDWVAACYQEMDVKESKLIIVAI